MLIKKWDLILITGKSEFDTERNRCDGRNDCNWHILCLSKDGGCFQKKEHFTKKWTPETKEGFLEKISPISQDNLVYLDESGIQKYLYKERGYAKKGQEIYDLSQVEDIRRKTL
ncbi:hypothetical protein MIDIC_20027 [Alphaproteobacteria bacterium]